MGFSLQTHTWHGYVACILLVLPGVLGAAEASRHQRSVALEASGFLGEGRGAADGPCDACALIQGAGLEGLSVIVVGSIQITPHSHHV